jgi:hypothetical protein
MTDKEKKARARFVEKALEERYPAAECALKYEGDAWRLLVMGRLVGAVYGRAGEHRLRGTLRKVSDVRRYGGG